MISTESFEPETFRHFFGLNEDKDIAFADGMVSALQKIDRGLLPPAAVHPYAGLISIGTAGVSELIGVVENGDRQERLDGLDALAHILAYAPASTETLDRLKQLLNQVGQEGHDDELAALLSKTIALGKDEAFLHAQFVNLASDDPGLIATSARLLGFGKYEPAVPVLNALVSPERFYESRYVIWALGEIGSDAALPILGYSLAAGFRAVDCMIAMGKIRDISSIPKLTPMILQGLPEQRDAAYRALSMILAEHREFVQSLEHTCKEFAQLIIGQFEDDRLELSGSTRFHMALCLARLGQKLEIGQLRRYLGTEMDEREASDMQAFFMRKR